MLASRKGAEARRVVSDDQDVLGLESVTVSFGGVNALNEVSLRLPADQLTAIVGPNGAGKSTLLNVVSGLVGVAQGGRITLLGEDVTTMRPDGRARRGIGRSFQHPPLLEGSTVMENILLGAHGMLHYSVADQVLRPRRFRRAERDVTDVAMEALRFAGIERTAPEKVSSLTYGTRKLVDIVRAMVSEPALLLLDEPTSGLDSSEQEAVGNLLLEWCTTRRVSILIVEHHMDLVRSVASRVLGLVAGSLVVSGTAGEVLDSHEFRAGLTGAQGRVRDGTVTT